MSRRVVVTGIGIVCPLGVGRSTVWQRLLEGHSGIVSIKDKAGFGELPSTVAGLVPEGKADGRFDPERWSTAEWRTMSRATAFALHAADEAVTDSQLDLSDPSLTENTGVAIGAGMADLDEIHLAGTLIDRKQSRRISPYFVPKILTNMSAGAVAMRFGLHGPNHSVATACATGVHAIGDACNFIRLGYTDRMLAGACEACVSPISVAGFSRLRALSTNFSDSPGEASRPFDKNRDGFVIAEGAAVFTLETLEHAKLRNARIYCEILGYGLSADAHHLTAPDPDGKGAYLAMRRALTDARRNSNDVSPVSYVNAHATSTPMGDSIECAAIDRLRNETLGNNGPLANKHETLANNGLVANDVIVSSTKGATGHLLGAAGAVEAAFTVLAISAGQIPPTINLTETDIPNFNFAPNFPQKFSSPDRRIALCNSFGFGGTNASICMGEVE